MSQLNISYNSIKTHLDYKIFEGEKTVIITLKDGTSFKAIPDIFSSFTNKLYVNILAGVTLYPMNITEIKSSDDKEFDHLMRNTIRKMKFKKLI
jgi:hypothetical protein